MSSNFINNSFEKIIDKCIECYENNDNDKKIKDKLVNPLFKNIKKMLFPYIFTIFLLFFSILVLVIIILILMIIK